jgi:3-(3-hydroxy-phenyl)propionate hydroxylase
VIDVAIVGCGPVGALLANLLGASGLQVAVFERDAALWRLPRAVHFDGEVMRIFQAAGLATEVAAIARPGTRGMHFVDAAGRTLLIRGVADGPGPQGWATSYYFHQPDLERVLRAGLARFPNVRVELGREVRSIAQTETRATLEFEGEPEREQIAARYVVGCDGARSLVRRRIGGGEIDLGLHQPWLVVDLLLKRDIGLPDHTVQHCNPARPMTEVCVSAQRRRWEIMLMPGDDPAGITAPERVWALIGARIAPQDAEIERAALYTFHSLIAARWRDRRLLIAGDSAHQTPPFLGQGMCAGMRDAANLAWKLAAVIRRRAPDSLLETYASERLPQVRAFIALAVELGGIIQTTDPARAAARDRSFAEGAPRVFQFPAPALGPGAYLGSAPAGTLFPQPRLADGARLDDVVGDRFAVIGPASVLEAASAQAKRAWRAFDVAQVPDPGSDTVAWLRAANAQALVLRPDRYVFALARDAQALDAASRALPGARQP